MFSQFAANPVLFRVKYVNRDIIETTRGSNTVLGEAVHFGLQVFFGGSDEYPTPVDEGEALKLSLDATLDYITKYPDGFINWSANVPTREKLQEKALTAIPQYIREWDRSDVKEIVMVEEKLEESVRLTHGNLEIEMPVPLRGYTDLVYEDTQGRYRIVDHKTTFSYTNPDSIDGAKLLQAAMYYVLVTAKTGKAPYDMTFREYKISNNKDGSAHTREYQIIYEEMPMVFDLLFRMYEDITKGILGEQVYVPNLQAMFDRDVAILAYINKLDIPDVLEKEKKKARVEDVAVLLQKKMAKNRNMKRFMEAKASLFTSHITLNYEKMQPQEKIKYKMLEHGVALNFSDKVDGLSVELYRYEPSVGTKMSTLDKFQKDIEQALGVEDVRILAPIPGTSLVGFEVPKKKRHFIDLKEAKKAPSLEVPFGVDVYGTRRDVDIRDMPHLLVGGTTGSGKSKFLSALITHLSRLPQHEVRFALLDPKRVELQDFQDDKHVDFYREEPEEILAVLGHYVDEMDTRYKTFKKHKVKNLEEYREKVDKKIPYVVIVIDEFGDLVGGSAGVAKETRAAMIHLARKARAAGIHLIITTQSPRAKVVDGEIKANFPARVAFKTTSKLESEIIIDRAGAELLLGKGDMLVVAPGAKAIERLQGYLV